MAQHYSESTLIKDEDDEFHDALEQFPFIDSPNSFEFNHDLPFSNSESTQSKHTPELLSVSSSAGLRRRRCRSHRSWKERSRSQFKETPDGLVDFDLHGSTISPGKTYKISWNSKNNEKLNDNLNLTTISNRLNEESNGNSMITSVITTNTDDESITADSSNSGSNFPLTLARLLIKAIGFQTNLLITFITLPIWLIYSSYIFLINPFAIMRRGKRFMVRNISRFLGFCYGNVKSILHLWIERNRATWKLFLGMAWGLLWSVYVGLILVGLLVLGFIISGLMMKLIMEKPVRMIEQLDFDYRNDTPMAFVSIKPWGIPVDHKLQATVLLKLPESDYNRNLGIFQVRVDFLSGNGKPLSSTTQPCMLKFKSQPIRLVLTFFKLAPLITGYSSESQNLEIKFKEYTKKKAPISFLRVLMEKRAEFGRVNGVPEIYSSYIKLESQLPLLKRILWSWKISVFVWISIVMFIVELLLVILCCTPIIVPWVRPRGVDINNN